MAATWCPLCETQDCGHPPRIELPDDYPFATKVPQPPEPSPRRARRLREDRMRRPETHERGGEDR